ncbi:TetR/AcrR family transcriptional regulator [Burkholderia cepacia]|uniref:TetR/AcrR family transcriptional regulator n=1 Tax=Burkholderia cepacia TaxID=292 RepID=UPI00075F670F|nr:TetR/AcrR family transcriptional regulator [Burkholderia cepacia]KVS62430.1 hypothetical protein WK41_32435 [Burkholderia cepacia]
MTSSAGRPSSRDKLLDAAITIVTERGVQHLTIEAVAEEAGVTKAGLIYHFKTRDELLAALVERMAGDVELQSTGRAPLQADVSPRVLIDSLEKFIFNMKPAQKRLLTNMLAAVSTHPQFVSAAQPLYERSYECLGHGPAAGLALLLAAALDGVQLLEMLNLYTFTPVQRDALRLALQDLARTLP